ncbi:MAG: zinc ribbon domain-containing protein [Pyrinomonadaceae bacterium]
MEGAITAVIMSSNNCTKCGAEIVAGSRFCRRCGQPAADAARSSSRSSVLEAETRTFAPPTDYATPTEHINAPLTGPAYMSPGQTPAAPPAAPTNPLKSSGTTAKLLLICLLAILLLVPVAFAFMRILKSRTSQPQQPPVVTIPEIPAPPPMPTMPTARGGPSAAANPLVYPGAEIMMERSDRGKARVLQLRTSDPFDKVVEWYTEKLKPDSITKVPGDVTTVLHSEGVNVVITAGDAQTEIIVNQGND